MDWLSVCEANAGFASASVRGSFFGESACKTHVPNRSLYAVYLVLKEVGFADGLKLFGTRVVDFMPLQKKNSCIGTQIC